MAARLPAIMRTTAARLSALYFILFASAAVALVFYMTSLSARMLTAQTMETINEEVQGLGQAYQRGGLPLLVRTIDRRGRQPGANLYLIADPNGQILSGNVESLDAGVLETEGWTASPFAYQRFGEAGEGRGGATAAGRETPTATRRHEAIAVVLRLPNQMIMMVGRDLGEPEQFRTVVRRALGRRARRDGARRAGDLVLRRTSGAEAHRQRVGGERAHHGGRSFATAAGGRRRRRVRPAVGEPQRHAGAHRRR